MGKTEDEELNTDEIPLTKEVTIKKIKELSENESPKDFNGFHKPLESE